MAETLKIVVFNAVGVQTGEKNGEHIMKQAAQYGQVLLGCEADSIDTRNRTNPVPNFDTLHKGADVNKDGSIVAVQQYSGISIKSRNWSMISPHMPGKMNSRWLLEVGLKLPNDAETTWGAAHAAPGRYPRLRSEGLSNLAKSRVDLFAGDMNVRKSATHDRFKGREIRSGELLHVVSKKNQGYRLGKVRVIHLAGSDHPGIVVTVILD